MDDQPVLRDTEAVIFDWGGTLCDLSREMETLVACAEGGVAWCQRRGFELPADAVGRLMALPLEWRALTGTPPEYWEYRERDMLREWLDRSGIQGTDDQTLRELSNAFWAPWVQCLDRFDGVLEMLDTLRDRRYVLGLLSNVAAPPDVCEAQLRRLEILPRLHFAEFSSRLGRRKPHATVFTAAMDHVHRFTPGVPPERVLFVGDTPDADVLGPSRFGMRTALVHRARQPSDARPDLQLARIADLPHYLPARPDAPLE